MVFRLVGGVKALIGGPETLGAIPGMAFRFVGGVVALIVRPATLGVVPRVSLEGGE